MGLYLVKFCLAGIYFDVIANTSFNLNLKLLCMWCFYPIGIELHFCHFIREYHM